MRVKPDDEKVVIIQDSNYRDRVRNEVIVTPKLYVPFVGEANAYVQATMKYVHLLEATGTPHTVESWRGPWAPQVFRDNRRTAYHSQHMRLMAFIRETEGHCERYRGRMSQNERQAADLWLIRWYTRPALNIIMGFDDELEEMELA